jgi:hypothetical protein
MKQVRWKKEYTIHWDGVELEDKHWISLAMGAFDLSRDDVTTAGSESRKYSVEVDGLHVNNMDRFEHDKFQEVLDYLNDVKIRKRIKITQVLEETKSVRDPRYWLPLPSVISGYLGESYVRIYTAKMLSPRAKPEIHFRAEDEMMGRLFHAVKATLRAELRDSEDIASINLRTGCEMTRIAETKEHCPTTYGE